MQKLNDVDQTYLVQPDSATKNVVYNEPTSLTEWHSSDRYKMDSWPFKTYLDKKTIIRNIHRSIDSHSQGP